MDIKQVKHSIVTPALAKIGLASPSSINLVTGIGAVESGYRTRRQNGGPALGFWQMEPSTECDCWDNFLEYRPLLAGLIRKSIAPDQPSSGLLVSNDTYAAMMCRVKLFRAPDPLPDANCALALLSYWKKFYNSDLGAGEISRWRIALFQKAIDA